jgi:hypothetical protein
MQGRIRRLHFAYLTEQVSHQCLPEIIEISEATCQRLFVRGSFKQPGAFVAVSY